MMRRFFPRPGSLTAPVLVVGIIGGAAGAAYLTALRWLDGLIGPDGTSPTAIIVTLVGAGLVIGLLTRCLGDPGDVELVVDNIHVNAGHADARAIRSLVPVSLVGIAAGGALGPEAPLVQTTGTVGTIIGRRLDEPPDRVRVLAIVGMAAAFTALFGAPLGSALFALEILHRRGLEYYEALLPALAGSLAGLGAFMILDGHGFGPVFEFPLVDAGHVTDLGWAALASLIGVAIAIAFTAVVKMSRRLFGGVPSVLRPAAGGLVVGLLSLWSFGALTFGEGQIDALSDLGAAALGAALVTKLLAAAACAASGWRGGFIIPLFFCGAAGGLLLDHLLAGPDTSMLVSAAMVAACVGVTKTPLGSTLVVTEMAGLTLLPTTAAAALIALVLTGEVGLIHSQRARVQSA